MLAIVVAHSANRVIGRGGALPWRLPTDLRRFRELTLGRTVLMGRRTFESLPDAFRPLPGRRNVVLSSDAAYQPTGAEVHPSLEAALAACGRDCFVIGGGATYAQALSVADRIYATQVEGEVDGDTFFPELSPTEWRCTERSARIVENDRGFSFTVHDRR